MPHISTLKASPSKSTTDAWVTLVAMVTHWRLGRVLVTFLVYGLSLGWWLVGFGLTLILAPSLPWSIIPSR
ncbi:hypothetical protein HanPSC8_Chr05g0193431 [Helianthus annuus]|nr:hypothetical protein HanPSC8_Chr05g0193431 [Helianthus annuus]